MADLILSASSVDAYLSCHYRWFLSYVESHEGEQSLEAAVGLAVHAGAEAFYGFLLDPAPDIHLSVSSIDPRLAGYAVMRAIESYELNYMLETAGIVGPEVPKMRAIGRRVLAAYLEDVASLRRAIMVEHAGMVKVNGIAFSYHIDLVTDEDEVLDLKVKKAKPRYPRDFLFQLTGYALGFRADTGRVEKDVGLDVMIRLKRDRPYLVPIRYGGPVSDHDIGVFARTLENVALGIASGDFEPTGLDADPQPCRWCNVRAVCEPYQSFLKITGEPDAPSPTEG